MSEKVSQNVVKHGVEPRPVQADSGQGLEVEVIYLKNEIENNRIIDTYEVKREVQRIEKIEDIEIDNIDFDFIDIFNAKTKEYIKSITREEVQ